MSQDTTLPPLPDLPTGAIMNGRTHIDRLEATGLECEAGTLSNCADWHELKHCFEFLAEWVDMAAIAAQAQQASPTCVWIVESKTFSVLYATKAEAEKYIASLPITVSGGMSISAAPVIGAQQAQGVPVGFVRTSMLAAAPQAEPQTPAKFLSPNGELVIDALRTAMDKASVPRDFRAVLIGYFCNGWNEIIRRAAAEPQPERERLCAAIKAEDDYCVTHGDYMLDSNDCIKIIRGEWVRPDYSVGIGTKGGDAK